MSDPLLDAGPGPQGPSVDSCPYCGGLGYDWEVVANGVGGFPPEKVSCPACGGTGKKTSGEAGPAPVGGGLDEARQSGEGPAGSSPEYSPDRLWVCQESGDWFPHPECPHRECDCEPVEYWRVAPGQESLPAEVIAGWARDQEREKWEARIEKLADKWDRGGEVVGGALPPAARELRSLLTGEDD